MWYQGKEFLTEITHMYVIDIIIISDDMINMNDMI